MTAEDEDALTWAGDDDLAPRRGAAGRALGSAPDEVEDVEDAPPGGRLGPVLVMLGVAAAVESALWVQGVFTGPIGQSLGYPGDTLTEQLAWALVLVSRIGAVIAPVVWLVVALRLQADERRRAAVAAVGVILLLPWPALVRLL